MAKKKRKKKAQGIITDQQNTSGKAKNWNTGAPPPLPPPLKKQGVTPCVPGRIKRSCSTSGYSRVTLATNPLSKARLKLFAELDVF